MVKWKLVFEFILTVLIPLLYRVNIQIIALNPNSVNFPSIIRMLGIVIAILGLIVWIMSFINLGKYFGVLPKKQKRLKTGLYKYLSHPMYVGIWCAFLGLSMANASWQGLIFLNIFMTPLLFIRALFEDKNLIN